jgi:putative hydrolase of the HAD superfamily
MNGRPQLVLDLAGVLITNLSSLFWQQLAEAGDMPVEELKERFNRDIRKRLWKGEIAVEQFWSWLAEQCPSVDSGNVRQLLTDHLQPLPAMEKLQLWSQFADIHLLSNHRAEWIRSLIAPYDSCIHTCTISSEAGMCKPDPDIYEAVNARIAAGSFILYVDDQEKNLQPAQSIGWNTMLADQDGNWAGKVDSLLIPSRPLNE